MSEEEKIENTADEVAKSKSVKQDIKEWVVDILAACIVAFIILQFIMPTIVQQTSMQSTLEPKDYIFVSKQAYKIFGDPQRGDVIVFKSSLPTDDGEGTKLLVKRIIAIGGDTIRIADGEVYVNGNKLDEPYLKDGTTSGELETDIPEGYLFCMGDNRLVSADSRDARIGLVSENQVSGKVVFRLFPFNKIGTIK